MIGHLSSLLCALSRRIGYILWSPIGSLSGDIPSKGEVHKRERYRGLSWRNNLVVKVLCRLDADGERFGLILPTDEGKAIRSQKGWFHRKGMYAKRQKVERLRMICFGHFRRLSVKTGRHHPECSKRIDDELWFAKLHRDDMA